MNSTNLSEGWIGVSGTSNAAVQERDIYQKAFNRFSTHPEISKLNVDLVSQATTLQDLEHVVNTVSRGYDSSRNHKLRRWLERFSSRLIYYAKVFDVLAQHHPEYVSLAWGAMKFLFIVLLNHENAIAILAKALARIAYVLPRIELATMLYPTTKMMNEVEGLYAHIMEFLVRAHDWYKEGTFRHILHSITRPAELHYKDLLENIEDCSRNIEQLAVAGSQVELRDMHNNMKLMAARLERSENTLMELKSLILTSLIDTNQKVTDIQFSEMIGIAVTGLSFNHEESFQQALSIRKLRDHSQRNTVPKAFWKSPVLTTLANASTASLILIRGAFKGRWLLRDAAVKIAEELHRNHVATLWAVHASAINAHATSTTPLDILKSLVAQALQLQGSRSTQKSTALCCTQLRNAVSKKQWLDILGAALANCSNEVYVILELELVDPLSGTNMSSSDVLELLCKLVQELAIRKPNLAVKIMIFTCRTNITNAQDHEKVPSILLSETPVRLYKKPTKQAKTRVRSSFVRVAY
ncbi:hypothetical protein BS50DRAFT_522257 [Corynespora cassiicola Philippines]|uniref:DUF7708 domain-containing protein n=1 Tax=Corynespora cassiicola Philippines TaxID=1448308 RepID=A0A2T2NQS6_CORCC|nr:hypothetical protein BS50DRAFT_522257 [Corynespora cassiicola Philippines]